MTADDEARLARVRAVRAELHAAGPKRRRPLDGDFERVALPAADCDILCHALVAHGAHVVIEVGLAYGSSALAMARHSARRATLYLTSSSTRFKRRHIITWAGMR